MIIPVYQQEVTPSAQPGPQASPLESTGSMLAKAGQTFGQVGSALEQQYQMGQEDKAWQMNAKTQGLGDLLSRQSINAKGENANAPADGSTPGWAITPQMLKDPVNGPGLTDQEIGALNLDPSGKTYAQYSAGVLKSYSDANRSQLGTQAAMLFDRHTLPYVTNTTAQFNAHQAQEDMANSINTTGASIAASGNTVLKSGINPDGSLNHDVVRNAMDTVTTGALTISNKLGEATNPAYNRHPSEVPAGIPVAGTLASVPASAAGAPPAPAAAPAVPVKPAPLADDAPPAAPGTTLATTDTPMPAAPVADGSAPAQGSAPAAPTQPAGAPPVDVQPSPHAQSDERIAKAQSAVAMNALHAAISSGNTATITDAYKTYGGYLEGKDITDGKTLFQEHTDTIDGRNFANSLYDPSQPLEAQKKAIDTQFADRPQAQATAIATLLQNDAIHNKTTSDTDNRIQGTLMASALKGSSIQSLQATPEYSQLDGNGQLKFMKEYLSYKSEQRRFMDGDPGVQNTRYVNLISELETAAKNPDSYFQAHDLNAINAMGFKLGPQGVKALADAHYNWENPAPGKPLPVTSWEDMTHLVEARVQAATNSGVSNPDLPSIKDKGKIGAFVESLRATQQRSGKMWTMDDTNNLIDSQMKSIVTGNSFIGSDPHAPLWQVENQVPAWFVQQGAQSGIAPSDLTQRYFDLQKQGAFAVPPAFASSLTDKAQAAGVRPPTPDQVQQRWFQQFKPKPVAAPAANPSSWSVK